MKVSGGGEYKPCEKCEDGLAYPITIRTDEGESSGLLCAVCLNLGVEVTFFPQPVGTKKPTRPKRIRRLAKKQDQQVMGGLDGGRIQPASGSIPGYKSDGRVIGSHRIETKYTFAGSFSLKLTELTKIQGECWGQERPVIVIDFKEKRTGKLRSRWACIPHSDWEKYANAQTADDQRSQDDP